MRYISESELLRVLPSDWQEHAESKLAELHKLDPEERRQVISNGSAIWSSVKNHLATCSNDKCWYCESKENRSDNAVDHFRPKGRVAECEGHEGYWWLAFDWHNLRYSCTFCNSRRRDQATGNSGGKQDHFPLIDESHRVTGPDGDIYDEQPYLLDPLSATDPQLLWFDQDGSAVPRYAEDRNETFRKRAEVSIALYHLNHSKIKEKRKLLANDIERTVRRVDRNFEEYENGNVNARDMISESFRRLQEATSEKAELSGASRAFLRGLRTPSREWIDDLL